MSVQGNKALVRRFLDEAFNEQNYAILSTFVTAGVTRHVPGHPSGVVGIERLRESIHHLFDGFPDLHLSVSSQIAEGDTVVTLCSWTGTHYGEYLGVPPTGKRMTRHGIVLTQLVDGKIGEYWWATCEPKLVDEIEAPPTIMADQSEFLPVMSPSPATG